MNVTKLKQLSLQFTTYRTKEISLKYYFFLVAFEMLQRKKSNIRQMLLQRQQHSLFPLKEKKNQNIISPSTSRLCQELTARLFPFFLGLRKSQ